MRSTQRYLTAGFVLALAPWGAAVVDPPPARADCTSSGYATVCAQGEVRGADGVPRVATPVVPYPCEYDWYCGTEWDLDIGWDPGRPNLPDRPDRPNRPGGGGGIGPR